MIKKSKILVIEDEKDVKDLITLHLTREGHQVTAVENGEEGLSLLKSQPDFDLVVLDWMLPGVSGLDICKKVGGTIPILMVTARADTTDIVLGLEMGADDFITKPFEIPVLLARARALLRRVQSNSPNAAEVNQLQTGNLRVDLEGHRVFCGADEVTLTPSEFKLLTALLKNQGRVLSREKLIQLVQGEDVAVVDRAIDTHVFGLRKKLGACANHIETIRGIGYRVVAG